MHIHDVEQGSQEWLDLRTQFDTASEAPAMMGVSKYMTRQELLRQKATGHTPSVDRAKQALFDRGHATEALARVIVEELIGEELYPVTASDGATLLASYDGLTMDERTGYEHKLWNEELAAQVRAGELDPHYYWQLEHQLLVGGLERIIFVCSDGTKERMVWMEYRAVPGRAKQLVEGWIQFRKDLAEYQHVEVLPAPVAALQPSLPAVQVRIDGALTVVDNLPAFAVALREYIKQIPAKPATDQEFADAEAAVKSLKKAEDALQAAEDGALSQMTSVEQLRRVVAELRALSRQTRLATEKMVEARKVAIRAEIGQEFAKAMADHLDALNARLGKPYMPAVPVDFAAAMKGKKTVTSLRDACEQALANGKIKASAIADAIQANMKYAQENATDYAFLFADFKVIVLKAADDFKSLVDSRISAHKLEEARKENERLQREAEAALVASIWANARKIEGDSVAYIQKAIDHFESGAGGHGHDERPRVAAAVKAAREELVGKLTAAQAREAVKPTPQPAAEPTAAAPITATAVVQPQAVQQAPVSTGTVRAFPTARQAPAKVPTKAPRPTDDQIIDALCITYRVHEATVLEWLLDMDLAEAGKRIEAAFTG